MSMAQTDMVLQSLEGLGGGVSEINEKMNVDTIDGLPGQVVTIMNQTNNATLVDITGKGKLCYAISGGAATGCVYKIEVDGNVFYAKNTTAPPRACGFFAKDAAFALHADSGTSVMLKANLPSINSQISIDANSFATSSTYIPLAELSPEMFEISEGVCKTGVVYTEKPLRFENSLKVSIIGTLNTGLSSGYNYIKYTLDD